MGIGRKIFENSGYREINLYPVAIDAYAFTHGLSLPKYRVCRFFRNHNTLRII